MNISDAAALFAALVAVLSAVYARRSWSEARTANQISLLGHRREIYDAFFALKMHMIQKAKFAEINEVSKFYYQAKYANIYLPTKLAKDINIYFDACFSIADIHRRTNGITNESSEECKLHIDTESSLAPQIDSEIIKLLKQSQA